MLTNILSRSHLPSGVKIFLFFFYTAFIQHYLSKLQGLPSMNAMSLWPHVAIGLHRTTALVPSLPPVTSEAAL